MYVVCVLEKEIDIYSYYMEKEDRVKKGGSSRTVMVNKQDCQTNGSDFDSCCVRHTFKQVSHLS